MEKMIPAVRSSAPLPPRDSSDKKQKESRVSACGSADAVSASKVISSVTTPSESSFSDREVHVEPVTTPQDIPATELEEEITTLEYLRSAIAGLAAWAGSETGADVTKILAKLPKIVPDDWMGLPIEELDRLGVGNFLRLLTYSTKVPEKAAKVIPAMQEAIQILGQMEGYERKDEVLGRLFNNLFGRNLILTTASALVCGLKTGKHSLALITKLGSLTGLLPHSALNYLNSTKANLSASASRIVGPLLLYSMYGDLTNIYTGYIRGQALQELGRPLTDIHEDGSVHVSEDVTMVRYLKEYNPEFYRLL